MLLPRLTRLSSPCDRSGELELIYVTGLINYLVEAQLYKKGNVRLLTALVFLRSQNPTLLS